MLSFGYQKSNLERISNGVQVLQIYCEISGIVPRVKFDREDACINISIQCISILGKNTNAYQNCSILWSVSERN